MTSRADASSPTGTAPLSGRLRALRRRDRCAVRVVVAMVHGELRRIASDPDVVRTPASALELVRSAMRGELDRHPDAEARAVSRALARVGA